MHGTPGGSNERVRTTWFDQADTEALRTTLDGVVAHLHGGDA
ncbi:hypothetical protein [Kitasatospora sp. NPDC001132]